MIRATTPTHTIELPFGRDYIKRLLITYKQGGNIVLEKTEEDVTFDGNVVSYDLTQEETRQFKAGMQVKLQIRVLSHNGKAPATRTFTLPVDDVLNDEVLA